MITEFFALALYGIDVKDVWTMFDFNRMVQLVIDLMSQSIYCVKRLGAAYLAEMVKSIGHPEAAIWHRWTIFLGAPLKIKYFAVKQETIKHLLLPRYDSIHLEKGNKNCFKRIWSQSYEVTDILVLIATIVLHNKRINLAKFQNLFCFKIKLLILPPCT